MNNQSIKDSNVYQYLFLGGIFGEALELPFVGNYLKVNKTYFEKIGIKDVSYKTLTSRRASKCNAKSLINLLVDMNKSVDKKIVIFAHSKAGMETLLAMGEDSETFLSLVHKVVLAQVPINGAPYYKKSINKLIGPLFPGLQSLSQGYYEKEINDILVEREDLKEFVANNLLFIKGYKAEFTNVSWIIKVPYLLCKIPGEQSDGLVRIKDQTFHTERYHHITLNIDHSDLFCSSNLSNLSSKCRSKIYENILTWINYDTPLSLSKMPESVQFREHQSLTFEPINQ